MCPTLRQRYGSRLRLGPERWSRHRSLSRTLRERRLVRRTVSRRLTRDLGQWEKKILVLVHSVRQ